jgi:hypothetical protein
MTRNFSANTMSPSSGDDCYTHYSTVPHVLLASFPNVMRWRCNSHCLDVTTYFFFYISTGFTLTLQLYHRGYFQSMVTLYLLRSFLSYICNNRLWNNYNIDIVNLLVVCLCMCLFFLCQLFSKANFVLFVFFCLDVNWGYFQSMFLWQR